MLKSWKKLKLGAGVSEWPCSLTNAPRDVVRWLSTPLLIRPPLPTTWQVASIAIDNFSPAVGLNRNGAENVNLCPC
jgi:hypothetical protein